MVIASGLMVREDDTKPRAYKLVTRLLIYLLTFALFRTHATHRPNDILSDTLAFITGKFLFSDSASNV